ncbi:RND family efflux transporter, MFP subunit [Enhydrobacter aerosaccus]|uniref:RND family efflux transporter, MFP subunit n=1 Tax=Enhydrobacter aerosaccus TaxID=225324 RepID=A0A1T4SPV0_9HYPH|nr:HlyD family efflux transporter periplasmic adaptor subunit [Enhydrobacter aerosaccus]SKA30186.1 RND family efflux transporter, MFP subunit [Enhydrobacter aerosaccus]
MKIFPFFLKVGLPMLAVGGVAAALAVASKGSQPSAAAEVSGHPPAATYSSYIAGAGLVEALGRNIEISTPVGGIIDKVFVQVGAHVSAGAPLFRIEGRDKLAELKAREANIPLYEAKIQEAEAALADYRVQLKTAETLVDKRALSAEEFSKRRANVAIYESKLAQAKADLANAQAQVEESRTDLERRVVRSPIDGEVLELNALPGAYAAASVNDTVLAMVGNVDRLAVRIDIDENDAWRFERGRPARASIRGNSDLTVDLTFEYVEPYVRPKKSLTGSSTERTDTRVLQVVYSFPNGKIPAYVGQQMDVFISAPAAAETKGRAAEASGR